MSKPDFYDCAAIEVYADRGIGCVQEGWDITNRYHPIQCKCPVEFIAKNDKGKQIRLKSNNIHHAVSIVKGHGFETQMYQKITGYHVLYKL